ncbi:hypothetical protein [Actinoplanes sp. NBRC 103695]|uniref:hypothetical protein n=1 Tax=Actinoplanes sp. NBRC 103695 TaxID=3032202 RepID=UPI0024A2FC08|nr:hypothetical protein [Actinoplanes sp. NBRC 103695]GLY98399.1 hypothetical protein Acsp02_56530 [Actinoplanes sp. NBRC 103695]
MRARRRNLVANLVVAVAIVLGAFTAPADASVQADGDTPVCPAGSAWDNRLKRCV